ncbi:hypothetical protein TSH7_07195 [Azospirillum sp. TSH7]|uniref:hypothetical protein n=1 Tax=unclassified Azospirillum TaxID=2630922 RepID=UPI000D6213BD|nr:MULTISPECIES: hypothetical protein [unclassified Azospirillum]PWC66064.1 hypothetical protein TSH7_07195 [Azospirillum sp. TSH7]PWC72455.1 hypothetical protein TSH20_01205 [Azospirillum sp. TSH20]
MFIFLLGFAAAFAGGLASMVARTLVRNVRFAEQYATQYVDAVEEIVKDDRFPVQITGFLVEMGRLVDNPKLARAVVRHFIGVKKLKASEEGKDEFSRSLDRLDLSQKNKFLEAVSLFLVAASYKDLMYGWQVRAIILSKSRQTQVVKESKELARMFPPHYASLQHDVDFGNLARVG